jgi:hypothetical protein
VSNIVIIVANYSTASLATVALTFTPPRAVLCDQTHALHYIIEVTAIDSDAAVLTTSIPVNASLEAVTVSLSSTVTLDSHAPYRVAVAIASSFLQEQSQVSSYLYTSSLLHRSLFYLFLGQFL